MSSYLIDDNPITFAPRAAYHVGTPAGQGLHPPPVDNARALYAGDGYIAGTLMELDAIKPGTAVLLIDVKSRRPIDEQNSAADGTWRFDQLAVGNEYLVLALHPARQYNAVFAHLFTAAQ